MGGKNLQSCALPCVPREQLFAPFDQGLLCPPPNTVAIATTIIIFLVIFVTCYALDIVVWCDMFNRPDPISE